MIGIPITKGQLACGIHTDVCMTNGRRVAFITGTLADRGVQRVMLSLAEGFASRGLAVDLVVVRAEGPLRHEVPDNVRLVDLGASRIITSFFPLARYLRRERPAAAISALSAVNCLLVWARALTGSQVRLILTEHSTLSVASRGARTLKARLLPSFVRWTYSQADAIVAVSRGVADDLADIMGAPRERIVVIHNPVVTSEMREKSYAPIDHPWFAHDQPPVIVAVGRLTSAKDFATLIRAFGRLRARRETHLVILGDGEERRSLENLITQLGLEDDVDLPGFARNPFGYMRRADVFVLSSRWEGFGNVLVEAMACGTPVVATDCRSGPAEILENGKWGRLVGVGDDAALASAIEETLAAPAGNAEVRAEWFSRERGIDNYLRLVNLSLGAIEGVKKCHPLCQAANPQKDR